MKKYLLVLAMLNGVYANAQDDSTKVKGFKKDHLFTGGGITLSFSNFGTVLGASPVLGYRLNKWIDAGIVFNYIYSTSRHIQVNGDRLRQTMLGPGAFVRIYPVKFLFVQAQAEKNFITAKYRLPAGYAFPDGTNQEKQKYSPTSLLVGAGYCQGREESDDIFYYLSVSVDVLKDANSPYVENYNGQITLLPIIRAGLQIPLFTNQSLF